MNCRSLIFCAMLGLLSLCCDSTVFGQEGPVAVVEVAEDVVVEVVDEDLFGVPQQAEVLQPQELIILRYCKVQAGLARRCCELNEQQTNRLSAMNGDWIKNTQKELRKKPQQGGLVKGMMRFLGGARPEPIQVQDEQPSVLLPRLRKVVDEEIASILTKEQQEVFTKELSSARRFRHLSHAKLLVASIDRELFLSQEQVDALTPAIAEWLGKQKSDLYWQFYIQNSNYIPDLPQKLVKEHLNDEQRASYSALQTYNYLADDMEWQMMQHQPLDFVVDDK